MKFLPTPLAGAYVIELEPQHDERGSFTRTFCREEFVRRGLRFEFAQCSVSLNLLRGTLRGMHYQASPQQEAKLVRCTRGRIFDVIVDIRPDSPTRKRWFAAELAAEGGRMVYVPEGFAHGYVTLVDAAEVSYQISETYHPESARGFRWNDPAVAIAWPELPKVISARDKGFPDLAELC